MKPPEKKDIEAPKESLWTRILLIVALVVSLFSVVILYFGISAKESPPFLQKVVGILGEKLASVSLDPEEGKQIAEQAKEVLAEAEINVEIANATVEEMKEFVKE